MAACVAAIAAEDLGGTRAQDEAAWAGREEWHALHGRRMALCQEEQRAGETDVEHLVSRLPWLIVLLIRVEAVHEHADIRERAVAVPVRGQVWRAPKALVDRVHQRWRRRGAGQRRAGAWRNAGPRRRLRGRATWRWRRWWR